MGKRCYIMALLSRSQIKLSCDTVNSLYFPQTNDFEIELNLGKRANLRLLYMMTIPPQ